MKLIRFGAPKSEKPGIVDSQGKRRDLSGHFDDWNYDFFNNGGLDKLSALLGEKGDSLPEVGDGERWGSPVARPGKVICIGLNYSDHAEESGMEVPKEPVVFMKASNTVVGPYDNVIIPRGSKKTDWEVELGVVIGKDARYLSSAAESEEYIAGYCISHDVSEREYQIERCGQWTKGKSCDNFNPLGPWLLTKDETGDPKNLDMGLKVNGEQMQKGNTSTMVYDVFFLVHYLSQFMTLEAGDVISTGTPPGVGMGMDPQRYLKGGDEVELTIVGMGEQKSICEQA